MAPIPTAWAASSFGEVDAESIHVWKLNQYRFLSTMPSSPFPCPPEQALSGRQGVSCSTAPAWGSHWGSKGVGKAPVTRGRTCAAGTKSGDKDSEVGKSAKLVGQNRANGAYC